VTREATGYRPDESHALDLDATDPLASFRERFYLPAGHDGTPRTYLCGNSLGLQPRDAGDIVEQELDAWADLAVDGHFREEAPWYSYHELLREPMARIVGARPDEVVAMNGLTANLHLMMVSFYRPTAERHRILIEDCAFPSDNYAVRSQLRFHGYDPGEALIVARPRPGEAVLRTDDIVDLLEEEGDGIALVLLGGVNYYTGQAFDLPRITAAARDRGCTVGFDLAHAAGNVPLRLHDWDVDFAVWCTYKYLNAGPGSVAGCFVHRRHGSDRALPRFAGWWGNDPETRFRMHLEEEFVPREGADGWQLSNPPILAMAPLRASLEIFDEAGMESLRAKSERLTGYLEYLVDRIPTRRFEILTPREPSQRGCQLSIRVHEHAQELFRMLVEQGFVGDYRPPGVIRVAPVPLYNTYRDVWRFARALAHDVGADRD
jgi:kynureninase